MNGKLPHETQYPKMKLWKLWKPIFCLKPQKIGTPKSSGLSFRRLLFPLSNVGLNVSKAMSLVHPT